MIDKAVRIGLCEVTDDDRHFVMELETGLELAGVGHYSRINTVTEDDRLFVMDPHRAPNTYYKKLIY